MSADRAVALDLVQRMAAAWADADIPAIVALFVPDGVFISPGGRAEGQAAIAALAGAFFAQPRMVSISIGRVLLQGNLGAAEWVWDEIDPATHKRQIMQDAIVFELRDGKLIYWREYFDPAQQQPL